MKKLSLLVAAVLLVTMLGGCASTNEKDALSTRPPTTTTTAKENNPKLWAPVYCDFDNETYTVTDASIVFIDGKHYNEGTVFAAFGKHTLKYNKYNNEYTRELVFYRLGDLNFDQTVNTADATLLQEHLTKAKLDDGALHAADMDKNGTVDNTDLTLLQKVNSLTDGILLLAPADGITGLKPNPAIAELMTDYDPEGTKSMLLKDGTQLFHRQQLTLVWASGKKQDSYTVLVAENKDFSDAFRYVTEKTSINLANLIPDRTYYWKVIAGEQESDVRSFKTADTARTITIDGVDNTRDAGGWATEDGKFFKYGMIYRTAKLDDITEAGRKELVEVLGVTTDLDLRTPGEGTAGNGSPLGADINYINYDAPYYWGTSHGIASENYRDAWLAEIRTFADPANFPMAVHCSVGRDRTGTILLVIKGVCGVSLKDIMLDYELSLFSTIGGKNASAKSLKGNLKLTAKLIQESAPDGSFTEACEAYLLSIGITADEIAAIRANLVE